jgi:hypothetical protein
VATEGEKTEAQYLALFHSTRIRVVTLPTGEDGHSAPSQVLDRLDVFRTQYDLGDGDELWLMVDLDHHRPEQLSLVCQQAVQKQVGLAISNTCFELWLCLHHADVPEIFPDGAPLEPVRCTYFEDWLRSRSGSYNKSRLDSERFRSFVHLAVERARRLDDPPADRWPAFPGTHVYKLVERLIEASRA